MDSTKADTTNSKGIRSRATGCTTDLRVAWHPRVTMLIAGGEGVVQQVAYLQVYSRRWPAAVAWTASSRERHEIANFAAHVLVGHN